MAKILLIYSLIGLAIWALSQLIGFIGQKDKLIKMFRKKYIVNYILNILSYITIWPITLLYLAFEIADVYKKGQDSIFYMIVKDLEEEAKEEGSEK